jgi:hypothetical protein
MVKKKNDESEFGPGWLDRSLDRIDRKHPVIAERWFVNEVTPSVRYSRGDGHGGSDWDWTREKRVRVSDYFKSKAKAQEFINEHEPDAGKTLEIYHDKCRRYVHDRWSSESRF